jgi:serine/threonine-protein kinase
VASDVFALGVVLYERLTGRLPFGGANHFAVMEQVRTAEPIPPRALNPALDRELDAITRKCLERDPRDRYSGADELAEDLDRYARGEPVAAQPPGFWDWLRQLARTRPDPNPNYSWPVTVWFGLIILALNGVIYTLVRTGGPAAGVWVSVVAAAGANTAVLWWYMLRKFRQLPPTERHSLILAAGTTATHVALALAYVPLSVSVPAREALGMYPALAAVSGLGMFVLGSTNWSRFFPVGLGLMALAPVLARWPDASPLVFGCATAAVMFVWSYVKKVTFGRSAPASE